MKSVPIAYPPANPSHNGQPESPSSQLVRDGMHSLSSRSVPAHPPAIVVASGSAVPPSTTEPDERMVIATELNLRSSPKVDANNVIGRLFHGDRVHVLEPAGGTWLRVRTASDGNKEGYVAASYVAETRPHDRITRVDFAPSSASRRSSTADRYRPLGEPIPQRGPGSAVEQTVALQTIVDALNVEKSIRYLPTATSTFCNIYAYDYCYFADVYLPRVWWTSRALLALEHGQEQTPEYGKTVHELTANALYQWLREWGDHFGWRQAGSARSLQDQVNVGAAGVICAQRRNPARSGHITCVIPEGEDRQPNKAPLQSQAGAKNKSRFRSQWWVERADQYSGVGLWYHP